MWNLCIQTKLGNRATNLWISTKHEFLRARAKPESAVFKLNTLYFIFSDTKFLGSSFYFVFHRTVPRHMRGPSQWWRARFTRELQRGVYAEAEKIRGAPVHPSTGSWIRPCGGSMSGGASLGLRSSGSYGSLPQQQLGGCQSSSPPLAARKPANMSLGGTSGPRVCARICKLAGRRQRMLLLLLVSVAVAFCFLFSSLVSKGGGCLASCSSSNLWGCFSH